MKKAPSAENGTAAVDAYLAGVPEPARTTLQTVRERIRAAAPKAATETISYRMPAFRHNGVLVSYAAFKNHCSFFPMGSSVLEAMLDEVKPYRTAKGTLQFPLDKPLPASLIRKIVKARVAQNEEKQRG
jgi:uncharacterized protein YdhG (YjbR/CyaY superfamily)